MPVDLTCQNCSKPFRVKPKDAARKYCSITCMRERETSVGRVVSQIQPLHFTCRQCGADFTMKPSYAAALRKKWGRDPLYCSTRCMGDAKKLPDAEWQVSCVQCGKPMPIQRRPGGTINRQKRLCSTECRSAFRRLDYQAKHPDQVPTRNRYKNGYWRVVIPGKNGGPSREVFEHRYVMEQHLGRPLLPAETVHHVDGDRGNNSLGNLELFSSRHGPGQRVIDKIDFAIEMLRLYPEFAARRGVMLVDVPHQPADLTSASVCLIS